VVAHPEVLVQLRQSQFRTPRVLTCTEGKTEASVEGEDVEVRRSPQAVACRKRYVVELGKSRCTPAVERTEARYAVIETRKRNPDTDLD